MIETIFSEALRVGKVMVFAAGLAMMLGLLLAAKPADAKTFTVNYTGDGTDGVPGNGVCNVVFGLCSLRAAIQEANHPNNTGADTINFNIFGSGVKTIKPNAQLPVITEAVTINGYSQPGAKANTLAQGNNAVLKIELSGLNAGANNGGLEISAANSTVKGLIINDWDLSGVLIFGGGATGNKIMGNYIGTDKDGTADLGNSYGVFIFDAPGNTIGGTTSGARNIISGNDNGVRILNSGATGNKVMGNRIGTDASGTQDLGNSISGVFIFDAPGNTIGGTDSGARNIISGNDHSGVRIEGTGATGNQLMGNRIGTSASGTSDLGNTSEGVVIDGAPGNTIGGTKAGARNIISANDNSGVTIFTGAEGNKVMGNRIGTSASGTSDLGNSSHGVLIFDAPGNTIGGTTSGARNIISGNEHSGVRIVGTGATGNQVMRNRIGTDASGKKDLGNSQSGVSINDAPNNTIGGTDSGARNTISGNNLSGVGIAGSDATSNQVMSNYIGTDKDGTADLGNSTNGVVISAGASGNFVGGASTGARNIISGNDQSGVIIAVASAMGNRILFNSIHNNGLLGIDLGNDGVTANDPPANKDSDTGPNNLQNFPVLSSAAKSGKKTTIEGTLNSTASTTFTVQFFSSPAADPSGNGEGKRFLGQKSVTTDSSGNASFIATTPAVPVGQVVTATATNETTGDTSEFSVGKQVL